MTEQRPPDDSDDLGPWAEDDLVRALRAPGTATELADEQQYVAAFRAANRPTVTSLPRRAVGRLGAGGSAVVVTVALTSGVAAAYTGHLPAPVQSIAHRIFDAPAPASPGQHQPEAGSPGSSTTTQSPGSGTPSATGPADGPSTSTTSAPATPGTSPGHPGANPSPGGTQTPGASPSGSPTSGPTSSTDSAAAASMTAPTHRVGLGQTTTLTSLLTDDSGAALPGQVATLQVRGPRHWRAVIEVTSDATGVATASTPPVLRSARFRWHAGPGVNSLPWLVKMVPTLTVTADVGATTTTVTPSALGASAGDRVQLFRHVAGRTTFLHRARLDASGSVPIMVATPRGHATYVVRLPRTQRHAAVRARVFVVAPKPAAVSITGSAGRVSPGATATITGTVTSATGEALPGHKVVLLERGPARWRPVGHATSDATGYVSIATPPITATTRFRLRTDHGAHSVTWRIVEVPVLSASAQRSGSTLVVTTSTSGARAGDKVVLLRRVQGRLVKLRHSRLDASGSATFSVPARAKRTAYVVRLVATRRHGPASTSVVVPQP